MSSSAEKTQQQQKVKRWSRKNKTFSILWAPEGRTPGLSTQISCEISAPPQETENLTSLETLKENDLKIWEVTSYGQEFLVINQSPVLDSKEIARLPQGSQVELTGVFCRVNQNIVRVQVKVKPSLLGWATATATSAGPDGCMYLTCKAENVLLNNFSSFSGFLLYSCFFGEFLLMDDLDLEIVEAKNLRENCKEKFDEKIRLNWGTVVKQIGLPKYESSEHGHVIKVFIEHVYSKDNSHFLLRGYVAAKSVYDSNHNFFLLPLNYQELFNSEEKMLLSNTYRWINQPRDTTNPVPKFFMNSGLTVFKLGGPCVVVKYVFSSNKYELAVRVPIAAFGNDINNLKTCEAGNDLCTYWITIATEKYEEGMQPVFTSLMELYRKRGTRGKKRRRIENFNTAKLFSQLKFENLETEIEFVSRAF